MFEYDDGKGNIIESETELDDKSLIEAFGAVKKPTTAQQAGANALTLAQQTVEEAAPALSTGPGSTPGAPQKKDALQSYYDYLHKGLDMKGPRETQAAEQAKVEGERDAQKGVVAEQWDKYNIKTEPRTVGGTVSDVMATTLNAAIGLPETFVGLLDIPTKGRAGYYAEKAGFRFKDAKQELEYFMSPQQQEINRTINNVQDFGEMLKYGIRNPSYILQQVVESLPAMLAGGAIGRGVTKALPALTPYIKMAEKIAPKINPGIAKGTVELARGVEQVTTAIGAGVGEGAVTAGQITEQVRQNSPTGLLEWKQIGATTLAGTVTGMISTLGGAACQRLGIADIDVLLVGGTIKAGNSMELAAKRNVLLKVAGSMLEEGFLEELPQSAQEQFWQNIAEGKPPMQGVAQAAAVGWLSGTVMGGMAGGYQMRSDYKAIERAGIVNTVNEYIQAAKERQAAEGTEMAAPVAEEAAPSPITYETRENGDRVALQDGVVIGSLTGGNLQVNDEVQGDRNEIIRTLLSDERNDTSDVTEGAGAPTILQSQQNASQGQAGTVTGQVTAQQAATQVARELSGIIKGLVVEERADGTWMIGANGVQTKVTGVEHISPNEARVKLTYAEGHQEGVVAGSYQNGEIKLVKGVGDVVDIAHESTHWLEDLGLIDENDQAVLKDFIQHLVKDGQFVSKGKEVGGSEDRARWVAQRLTYKPTGAVQKIIQKIQDFIDRVANAVGFRTAQGVVRDVKTGKVWENTVNQRSEDAQYSIRQEGDKTFVVTPEGDIDFGYVSEAIGKAIRRQAGPIRLEKGTKDFGQVHIVSRHGKEIQNAGFKSVEELVDEVSKDYTAIYAGYRKTLQVSKPGNKNIVAYIELQPSPDGDYYTVNSAFVARGDFFKNKTPLWEGAQSLHSSLTGTPSAFTGESSVTENIADGQKSVKEGEQYSIKEKDDTIKNASQQTTGETGTATVGSVQGSSEKEFTDSIRQTEAAAVEELKQSQSYEEFEKVVLGNVNWGDTFNEDPLPQRMSKEDWRQLEREGRLGAKVQALQVEKETLKDMIREARRLANDMFNVGRKIGAYEQLEKIRELQKERKINAAIQKEMSAIETWLGEALEDTYKRNIKMDPDHRKTLESLFAGNVDAVENFLAQRIIAGEDFITLEQDQLDLLREFDQAAPTLEGLRNLQSLVKMFIYQGRKARMIEIATQEMELKYAIDDMVDEIRTTNQVPELDRKDVLRKQSYVDTTAEQKRFKAKVADYMNSAMALLKKAEYIIKNLVAYDTDTKFYQGTFQAIADAEGQRIWLDMNTGKLAHKAFQIMREEYRSGQWQEKTTVTAADGTSEEFTRNFMVGIALNSGCKDNIRAMMDGNDLSEEMIKAVNEALTPEEKAFVHAIWDIFRWQLPHLQKAYRHMMGDDMVLVDGIYYPMIFNKDLSGRLADAMANADLLQTMGTAISVNRGRTMSRKGGREALDFDPLKCLQVIDSTNQFIAYGETIRNVNRVLSNQRIKSAITDAIGEPYHAALKDWLRRIASPQEAYSGGWPKLDKWIGTLRNNAQVAVLGWALSTAVMQPMAITMTVNRLGFANTIKGFIDFYSDYDTLKAFCTQSSGWLSTRIDNTGDYTLSEMKARNYENVFGKNQRLKESYFTFIRMADTLVTLPTWYTAYQTEFAKSQDHGRAVVYADEITRNSQSSSGMKDLATIQTGSNFMKSFTMFYSFFSAQFNEMTRSVDLVKHGKIGMLDLMKSTWWVILVPAILQAIIKSRGWYDEDKDKLPKEIAKDIGKETAGYAASSIPIIGSIVNAIVGGYDFRPTPASGAVDEALKIRKSLKSSRGFFGKRNDQLPQWMRSAGLLAGYLFGLPSRQIMRTADEVWSAWHKGPSWKNVAGLVYKEERKKK